VDNNNLFMKSNQLS